MTKFYETVLEVLRQDNRFFTEDGTLLRNAVYEAAMQMDGNLLRLLLSNEETKSHFFKEVDGIAVFDKVGFGWVVNNREFLPDSYTRFKNKIGLADEKENLLVSSGKVELIFPYKDCVLEGGQTREAQERRSEVFFNELLAPDEIDRLLFPKVFSNAHKYSMIGTEKVEKHQHSDNLIIKGNNLLALSSLVRVYEGKIKCIYIDPPYNTGNDGFMYNDSFNHSTWLVFMKNRLQLAHRLLRNDGSIFVQCDDFEDSYLKVLMDEIFGRENFRNKITWKRRGGSANPQNRLNNVTDYILWYQKSEAMDFTPIFTRDDEKTQNYIKERFTNISTDGRRYMLAPVERNAKLGMRQTLRYEYKGYIPEYGWMMSEENLKKLDEEGKLHWNSKGRPNRRVFEDEYPGQPVGNLWTDIFVINPMAKEAIDFTGQKPEALIKRILEMCTHEGDIVLDFFMGTGTTAATALKMNRQFIGIEQMDYIEDITIERLKAVIAGDASGISPEVNWQGGGSFVYCELAKANQIFVDEIQAITTEEEIVEVYKRIVATGFISSKVNPKDIENTVEEFNNLSTENKKRFLMELLDKNLLYVNYCDIDDEEFSISDTDKAFTRSFYGEV